MFPCFSYENYIIDENWVNDPENMDSLEHYDSPRPHETSSIPHALLLAIASLKYYSNLCHILTLIIILAVSRISIQESNMQNQTWE